MKKASGEVIILHVYQKSCSYNVCFLRYGCDRHIFWSFWAISCSFTPLLTPKIKIKIINVKKPPGDIILFHICTKNEDHRMYGSWDIRRNRPSFLSFWAIFCPLTLLTTQKIKILRKWKMYLEILSFYTCLPQIDNHMM